MTQIEDVISVTKVRENLSEIMGEVRFAHRRIMLSSNGKNIGAIIPLEDLELLEAIEDKIDIELAEKADKDGKTYTFDEVLQEMGLTRKDIEKSTTRQKSKSRKVKQTA